MPFEVLDQHAWVVEAHRLVVEQAAAKLDRMIELEPRRLVCSPRESGCVRAAEAIHGEPLDRREQLVSHLTRNTVDQAALDESALERRHLDVVQEAGHRAPETVSPTGAHARDAHRD